MMKIEIAKRSGVGALTTIELPETATVLALKKEIYKKCPRLPVCRQRLTYEVSKPIVVLGDNEKKLSEYGLTGSKNVQLMMKDLGPQLSFRAVFLVEYLGPLVLYPLFAQRMWAFPTCLYGWLCGESSLVIRSWLYPMCNVTAPLEVGPMGLTFTQGLALFLWTMHFMKRELETVFVHEFGDLTMPVFNIFKNSIYYWGFGLFVSYFVNAPCAAEPPRVYFYIGLPLFLICVACNFICHMILRSLRKPGSSALVMPRGFMFEYVTAPNYFFEIMTWVAFNILTGFTAAGVLFNIVGALQMWSWAKGKHALYRKTFPHYPKNRKILVPFIL